MNEKLDLFEFLPSHILTQNKTKLTLSIKSDDEYLYISYQVPSNLGGYVEYDCTLPRFISKNIRTFEVIGLLQAEMGKKDHGTLSFTNHEYRLMNYVLNWFEKELELKRNQWQWAITININKPADEHYRKEVEEKVVAHWTEKTSIPLGRAYPVKVWYIKDTKNTILRTFDRGSLVVKYRNNLYSQVIKEFVRRITYEKILTYDLDIIRAYMRGIIAGEGCVQNDKKTGHYSIHLTAMQEIERILFKDCLKAIGIFSKVYENYKDILISERSNLVKLLQQRIMTLSPQKYSKFLFMMQQFDDVHRSTHYFKGKGKNIWNKIPQEKITGILETYKSGVLRTKEIANKMGVSQLKVQRVLFENNLGKRVIKTGEAKRREIADFAKNNTTLTQKQLAERFLVHESVVRRACKKFNNDNSLNDL